MDDFLPRDMVEQKISELIDLHKESDGAVETGACSLIEDELADFLEEVKPETNWRQVARELLTRFRKSRRHRRKPGQSRLFEPDALYALSVEETRVIREADARRVHLIQALQVRTVVHMREQEDYTEDIRFISSRIQAFQSETETQLDVEKRDFGWEVDAP